MARRSDHSRQELRELVLSAAREVVEKEGISGLSTRALAKRIGYAPGTLYNVFHNLDDLIFALNSRTVAELRDRMEREANVSSDPGDHIRQLANGYLAYALAHPHLWRLAFQHQTPVGQVVPEETTRETTGRCLRPSPDYWAYWDPIFHQSELMTMAAALWAGVHGVCHLAVTDKLKFADSAAPQIILSSSVDVLLAGVAASASDQVGDVL